MKKITVLSLATSCAIFAASINFNEPAEDFTRVNPEFNKNVVLSYNSSIADAKKSVVNISTTKTVSSNVADMNDMFSDPFFKDFFGFQFNIPQEKQKSSSLGSGVVISSDGYIVTNNHVIDGAKEIIVSLSDGRSLKGKLIGKDEFTDLAVVKVDESNLPTATFGNSDTVVVGEPAIAIGNPLGLEFQGSVTVGVISALNRTLDVSDKRVKLLQTDAAISPGNSGGALVNADGEVIGINSAKVAAAAVEGMGFSIPINTVQTIVNELIEKGYVARPYLGVSVFDPATAARYGYQLNIDKGVYIFRLTLDGPCGKAGFQRGDIILEINGEEVNSVAELRTKIASYKVGDKVTVTYDRNDTKRKAEVTLEEMPQEDR